MKRIYLLGLLFLLLMVVGCNPAGGSQVAIVGNVEPVATIVMEATETPVESEEATADPAVCPEATAEMALLQDPAHGFCLLYPADYQVVAGENNVGIVKDSLLNVSDPRLGITIEAADEGTASQIADGIMADFPAEQWPDVARSSITVAGVEAEVLNNLPGQDLNRRVIFVHDGLLYDMFFSPLDDAEKSTEGQIELFYNDIIGSFQFMPVLADAPLQAGPECPEVTAETQLYRNEAGGYCLLIPADFTAEETEPGNTVVYFGSLMDVEHAKLFINVTDDGGRPLYEIVDELTAGLEDFGIERTFGLLVDGEAAELVGKMPGQDLNRQVIFSHDGRLYTLTFVPDEAAAGAAYEQMEAMYELALGSFSFLMP